MQSAGGDAAGARGAHGLKIVASLAVGGLFLWLAVRQVSWPALADALGHLDARWLVVAVAISLALQLVRVWRWQLELAPLAHVPFGLLWVVTCVAYMAINLLPARLGEVVRPWLLSRRTPLSFGNVVGNLVVEKTMDSAVILFYILAGLVTTANLPDWVRLGARVPAIAFVVMAVLVVLVFRKGEQAVAGPVHRFLPATAADKVLGAVRNVVEGMRVLGDPGLVLRVFLVSLGLWFLPILSSWVMVHAFAIDAPFNAALIVFIFIGFGTALPQAPGMIGTYQYACILALGLFGVPTATALAYGLVLNAVQLVTLVAQGLVALPLARVSVGEIVRARAGLARARAID